MSLYPACSDGTCCRVGCATCRRRREAKAAKGVLSIEWHRPMVEFWIQPDKEPGQWVTVSRYEGRLHVRGTYSSVPASYERIAKTAYEAMERGFKAVSFGRERAVQARVR